MLSFFNREKNPYIVLLSDLLEEPESFTHPELRRLSDLKFVLEQQLSSNKHPILVAFDLDRTLILSDPDRLTEPDIPDFLNQLNANPLIHTMGFTSRQSHSLNITKKTLAQLNIHFKCELPIDFNPDDCDTDEHEDHFGFFSHNPIFDDSSSILFTDYRVEKGLFLKGFLPSIVSEIQAFHMIDDNPSSLDSIQAAATQAKMPPIKTHHYKGPRLISSPTISNLYQLGRI